MHIPLFRALLVSGFALSFLAFTGCTTEETDTVEVETTEDTTTVDVDTTVDMTPAEELDSLGNVIEDAASDAADAVGEAAEAAGDAVEDATDGQ